MLISILIDAQYLQNVVFSFEKGSDGRIQFSGSHHSIKKPPQQNFPFLSKIPPPLNAICEILYSQIPFYSNLREVFFMLDTPVLNFWP